MEEYVNELYNSDFNFKHCDPTTGQRYFSDEEDIYLALIWKLKQIHKDLENDLKIFDDCKDGSGGQVKSNMASFNKRFGEFIKC